MIPLDECELPVRLVNCLWHGGYRTLEQVEQATDFDLLWTPNFGKVSLAAVRKYIADVRAKQISDPIDRDPPEHDTDMLVHDFETAASKIETALSDPTMRRLLMANRDRLIAACEAAFRIEARLLFGNEPALAAE